MFFLWCREICFILVHTCVLYSILWLGCRQQKPDKITQSSCFMLLWKRPCIWRQERESWKCEDSWERGKVARGLKLISYRVRHFGLETDLETGLINQWSFSPMPSRLTQKREKKYIFFIKIGLKSSSSPPTSSVSSRLSSWKLSLGLIKEYIGSNCTIKTLKCTFKKQYKIRP